jgi:hypothetical protein
MFNFLYFLFIELNTKEDWYKIVETEKIKNLGSAMDKSKHFFLNFFEGRLGSLNSCTSNDIHILSVEKQTH